LCKLNYNVKKVLLSGFAALVTCLSLHAAESSGASYCFADNAVIVGKEYLFVEGTPVGESSSKVPEAQPAILSGSSSSCIFIAENAVLYGAEHLLVFEPEARKQDLPTNIHIAKTEKKADLPAEKHLAKNEKPALSVLPDCPFLPSSSFYSSSGKVAAIPVSQQRLDKFAQQLKPVTKLHNQSVEDTCLISISPEQRQIFSIAAVQCGVLTFFGTNSPPLLS